MPAAVLQASRAADGSGALARLEAGRVEAARVAAAAVDLRSRARSLAGLLNRIAFLYRVPAAEWPKSLGPDRGFPASDAPERIADAAERFLVDLDRARSLAAAKEAADPSLVRESPAILPLGTAQFEPSAYFGPRRSPWTSEEEFLNGVEIACPAGTPVVAPADGIVAFAGTIRQSLGGRLWQLGNVVVLSHGSRNATVFGHLARLDVRRGARVERGAPLGTVGSSGWALSPQLHYEYWRSDGGPLRATDPLFTVLDLGFPSRSYSLEQMEATWAPGPVDPLPGVTVRAEDAAAPRGPPRPHRVRRRRL